MVLGLLVVFVLPLFRFTFQPLYVLLEFVVADQKLLLAEDNFRYCSADAPDKPRPILPEVRYGPKNFML